MNIAERIKKCLPVSLREPDNGTAIISPFRIEIDENGVEWIKAELIICGKVTTEDWRADGRYHPWDVEPCCLDLVPGDDSDYTEDQRDARIDV